MHKELDSSLRYSRGLKKNYVNFILPKNGSACGAKG